MGVFQVVGQWKLSIWIKVYKIHGKEQDYSPQQIIGLKLYFKPFVTSNMHQVFDADPHKCCMSSMAQFNWYCYSQWHLDAHCMLLNSLVTAYDCHVIGLLYLIVWESDKESRNLEEDLTFCMCAS